MNTYFKQLTLLCITLFFFNFNLFSQNVNLRVPPLLPQVFMPNLVNTGLNERDFTLSPNGNEFLYTLVSPINNETTILSCKKNRDGSWGKPAVANFSGIYNDLEPSFSPDGKRIYFSSKRPVNGKVKTDFDIWFVERKHNGWGEAVHCGNVVNTDDDEYFPSVTMDGSLFFTASYNAKISKEDIYVSRYANGQYLKPTMLDTNINSANYEFNAFVAPDESFILFSSQGRKDGVGKGDIYLSTKSKLGSWLPAKPVKMVNSDRLDYCPFVSLYHQAFFFTSEKTFNTSSINSKKTIDQLRQSYNKAGNGMGDIYWVSWLAVLNSLQ
jgi:hypothetical protein